MIGHFKVPKICILLGFFTLIVVHFILKDHFYLTGIIFYAFPLFTILGIGILCASLFLQEKKLFKTLVIALISLCIYWWLHAFHFEPKIADTENHHGILFWNIADQKIKPLSILITHVKADEPDFIALVETENVSDSIFRIYQMQLKDYQLLKLKGNMIIGSKHPINRVLFMGENDNYAFNHITVVMDGKNFEILLIDLYASPFHNKKIPFENIYNYTNKHSIDLVLGDFNTPFESMYFRELEFGFDSFRGLNTGLTYTWPFGLPLYELDQIWISKKHQALKLDKKNYIISDHSLLFGHFKTR